MNTAAERFAVPVQSAGLKGCSWTPTAAAISSIGLALGIFAGVQRSAFQEILEFANTVRPGPDPWLFPSALLATSVLLLTPAVAFSCLVVWLRPRAGRFVFVVVASPTVLLVVLDAESLRSVGRHVGDLLDIALQPQGHIAGGNAPGLVLVLVRAVVISFGGTALVGAICERLASWGASVCTPLLRVAARLGGAVVMLMSLTAPHLLLRAWGAHPLVERLYASMVVDVRVAHQAGDETIPGDPRLRPLVSRFAQSYRAAFPALTRGKLADASTPPLREGKPNVIVVVAESFRHDAFVPQLMPRLTRWSERGLVAPLHDAGTNYSQSGMFALLYGRSPATYHQTLDAKVQPQLCSSLRRSGYECAYFTGHPKIWLRREEFLNAQTMDYFVHDDRGSWPEWDRRALDSMVSHLERSEKPTLAIVLLMSSHFEYRYPPQYEVDRPVSQTAWKLTTVSALGPEAEVPHRNRYRNCMRFLDDLIGDAIDRLDPEKNLVIVTGDHGESINDDGHYTHGYSFADVETRTPFAMVGPGVPPGKLNRPSYHIDVLPSVLHALSGKRVPLQNVHGVDWFDSQRRASALKAHSQTRDAVQSLLLVSAWRLRIDFDLTRPRLSLLGFEDELGRLVPTPDMTEAHIAHLAAAFDEQLAILRH